VRQSRVIAADVLDGLRQLPDGSARCCVTSPPYWGLRDYGTAEWEGGESGCDHVETALTCSKNSTSTLKNDGRRKETTGHSDSEYKAYKQQYRNTCGKCGARRIDSQIGLEPTPEEYVAKLVEVFRDVRRVLADDGTVWLNLGDSYNTSQAGNKTPSGFSQTRPSRVSGNGDQETVKHGRGIVSGLKPKDLVGVPWRVAFALQADGWWLRSDIIWSKPNPMPESVTDRPTKAHEYIFMLSKSARYYFDAEAVREADVGADHPRNILRAPEPSGGLLPEHSGLRKAAGRNGDGRNIRSVWTIATQPYPEAHFATYPPALVEPCIKAGSAEGDTVLDPFCGAGTTGLVACRLNRNFVGIELNPEYAEMARARIEGDAPLLNQSAISEHGPLRAQQRGD